MKRIFLSAAVAALICGVASAQNKSDQLDVTPNNLTIRAGVVIPVDSALRDFSSLFGGIGIEYLFPTQLIKGSYTFASADWFFRGSTGKKGNVFPFALNQRFYSNGGAPFYKEGRNYFFVGAGVAIIDFTTSDTKYMFRGGVGTEIGPNIFAEGNFTWSDRTRDGIRATAVGFYLGYRF